MSTSIFSPQTIARDISESAKSLVADCWTLPLHPRVHHNIKQLRTLLDQLEYAIQRERTQT